MYSPHWVDLPGSKSDEISENLSEIIEIFDIHQDNLKIYRNKEPVGRFYHVGRVMKGGGELGSWLKDNGYDLVFRFISCGEPYIIKYSQNANESEILESLKGSKSALELIYEGEDSKGKKLFVEEFAQGRRADHNDYEFIKNHPEVYGEILSDIFSDLHSRGIFYNDAIPYHLIIDDDNNGKMIDFGNSYFMTDERSL